MRKKWLCLLMAVVLGMGLIGCASDDKALEEKEAVEEEKAEEIEAEEFFIEKEQYEAFQFLHPYKVEADSQEYVFYLPGDNPNTTMEDGWFSVGGDNGEDVGLDFAINPAKLFSYDPSYDFREHPMDENLDLYLTNFVDQLIYTGGIRTYKLSEVEKQGDFGATATLTYLYEDEVCFTQFYMFLSGDEVAIAIVVVIPDNATENLEATLSEIETYLGISVAFDESAWEFEEESMEVIDGGETVYTDFWKINLPKGWAEADRSDGIFIYTPGGRYPSSAMVMINEMEEGIEDDKSFRRLGEDDFRKIVEKSFDVDGLELEDYAIVGDTSLGYVFKMIVSTDTEYSNIYMVEDNGRAYLVIGMCAEGDNRALEAAEYIINHTEKIEQ